MQVTFQKDVITNNEINNEQKKLAHPNIFLDSGLGASQ